MTNVFAQLLVQPQISEVDSAQQKSYVTYTAPLPLQSPDAPAVTLLEARSVLASSGNTGVRTWEAALRLATYLHSDQGRRLVEGKTVLELGAGTGLLSILCSKHLCARYVLATDGNGDVVDGLQSNVCLNGLEGDRIIDVAVLKWGHRVLGGILGSREDARQYDLILGADIVSRLRWSS